MKCSEIMTTDLAIADPETTLEEIATIMKEEDVGAIPVVDDEDNLVGIVTDRDIVIRCIAEGTDPTEAKAEDILSGDLICVSPEDDVTKAAQLMADKQVRRLPVVEEGRLVGMISLGDLAVKKGDDDLSGETLEDVSRGVKPSEGNQAYASAKKQPSAKSGRSARPDEQVAIEAGGQAGGSRASHRTESSSRTELPKLASGRSTSEGKFAHVKQTNGSREVKAKKQDVPAIKGRSNKQGISSRSEKEENQRQEKVVPFREENQVRNERVNTGAKKRKTG